jgi:hypothetical protein
MEGTTAELDITDTQHAIPRTELAGFIGSNKPGFPDGQSQMVALPGRIVWSWSEDQH